MSQTDPAAASGIPTPDAWWVDWSRDKDSNGLDDAIERLAAEGTEAGYLPSGLPRYGFVWDADGLRVNVFVRYAGVPTDADVLAVAALVDGPVRRSVVAEAVYVPEVELAVLPTLLALDSVRGIELERSVVGTLDTASKSTLVASSERLGMGAVQRFRVSGLDTVIAVLDSGVDQEHEAFGHGRFLGGYDATVPLGTLDADPLLVSTPLNQRDPDDDSQSTHGTHVAGIALGFDPNATHLGMAFEAELVDVKVLAHTPDGAMGTSSTPHGLGSMVIEGMDFVRRYNRGESYLGDPGEDTIDIVSMSLSETAPDADGDSLLAHAVNRLVATGVVVVAAAGNCGPSGSPDCLTDCDPVDDATTGCAAGDGNNTIAAPGSARDAITVAAMNDGGTVNLTDDSIARFSSIGPNGGEPKPNLAAFGVDIAAPKGNASINGRAVNAYHNLSGTSMATPMVAGIAALLIHANQNLTPEEVKSILVDTARDVGDEGWDPLHGAGVVNAYFAAGVALGFLDPATAVIGPTGHPYADIPPPPPPEIIEPERENKTLRNRSPAVGFTFSPAAAQPGEDVVFVDHTVDPDGDRMVSWVWDFGDGSSDRGQRVSHRYEKPGQYEVSLTVTDLHGRAGSLTETVVVVGDVTAKESPAPPGALLLVLGLALVALHVLRSGHRSRAGRLL